MNAEAARVLVADDQRVVRDGLLLILELIDDVVPVGAAADGEEAIRLVAETRPDVVLMDLRMPHLDGIEATRRLREEGSGVEVIALTTYADDESVLGALRAGARGYLTKDAAADEIREAIERVLRGEAALDPVAQQHVVEALADGSGLGTGEAEVVEPALPDGLTPREAEVLGLIAEGLSNDEIAERLVVSRATVKSHVNHLFAKVGARDRAQAVAYAYRNGLARSED